MLYEVITISAKGYNAADFVCFSYGGAGPVHTYGYTEGAGFKDVIVPAWAAGFSAFGCACADFEYRYDKSVDVAVAHHGSDEEKVAARQTIQAAWEELAARVVEEFVIRITSYNVCCTKLLRTRLANCSSSASWYSNRWPGSPLQARNMPVSSKLGGGTAAMRNNFV